MEFVQQNINMQKTKLLNLINYLNSTLLIDQEIFINNEIKKECDILSSFLNEKQKYILNPIGINNNINPFLMHNPNKMMNAPQMNINPIQMHQNQLINNSHNNNFDNFNQVGTINIKFEQNSEPFKVYIVQCHYDDRICDVIEKYKNKANDYTDSYFLYNQRDLNGLTSTLKENKIGDKARIEVHRKGELKGGKYRIHTLNK